MFFFFIFCFSVSEFASLSCCYCQIKIKKIKILSRWHPYCITAAINQITLFSSVIFAISFSLSGLKSDPWPGSRAVSDQQRSRQDIHFLALSLSHSISTVLFWSPSFSAKFSVAVADQQRSIGFQFFSFPFSTYTCSFLSSFPNYFS